MLDAPAETATPLKQSLLHVGMWLVGRWFRTTVRQLLQQRVITGRRPLPIRFARTIEILEGSPSLRVTDTIELASPAITIRRMAFGTDHQAAYVAACGSHDSVPPWTELADQVEALNRDRRVVVVVQAGRRPPEGKVMLPPVRRAPAGSSSATLTLFHTLGPPCRRRSGTSNAEHPSRSCQTGSFPARAPYFATCAGVASSGKFS